MPKKIEKVKARLVKGFRDSLWGESIARTKMIDTIRNVYENYGFQPLDTPALEYVDVLGKFLPRSSTPDEGIFAFESEDEWIAMRYDLTAPLSRVVAQYQELPKPFRRYQIGHVWRMEKPGPGRFREFIQFDVDTVGSPSMAADTEICTVLADAMEELGIKKEDFKVQINNRKVVNGVLETAGIKLTDQDGNTSETAADVMRTIDKLDRLGIDGLTELLTEGRTDRSGAFIKGVGLSDAQADKIIEFLKTTHESRKDVLKFLDDFIGSSDDGRQGIAELTEIDLYLTTLGYDDETMTFDPTVVRGLSYYTGPVFEISLTFPIKDEKGRVREFGSVAGGGRYDDLVSRFTGQKVPATGASIGVDRLLSALLMLDPDRGKIDNPPVVVTIMDKERTADYLKITSELRDAGISAEPYLGGGGFNKQMKYADRRGAAVVVIAGSDEFEKNSITIKDLWLGRDLSLEYSDRSDWLEKQPSQVTVPRSDMIRTVKEVLSRYKK